MISTLVGNLLSPEVMFFILGVMASVFKSDLKFPKGLADTLSMYLLIAIGLKGGMELAQSQLGQVLGPLSLAILLGLFIPLLVYSISRLVTFSHDNGIALAATYGSVSIVTFGAAVNYLNVMNIPYESFMNAVVVLMESPAIFIALLLHQLIQKKGAIGSTRFPLHLVKETFFGQSVLLMQGSLIIGAIISAKAMTNVKPLFTDLYRGFLVLFLMYMGLQAGKHLKDLKGRFWPMIVIGIIIPIASGVLGVVISRWLGLSIGGSMIFGVLSGSASYIAAPAAIRSSIPLANPAIYLGGALGLTFPFNLAIGIPFYYWLATIL